MPPPELMAIGDSLYNGVRSATIYDTLAAHSPPAQIARAFNWDFVSPDYPRPILADIEKIFCDPLAGTVNLIKTAAANAHAWLADKQWSQHPVFHNLSIAQQTVADLYTANYAASVKVAQTLAAQGAALPLGSLPALYQALNTCFVLNPRQTAGDTRTAIDILAAEQPKRLLIHIGSNDGLWTLLLLADPTDFMTRIDPIANMRTLAAQLNAKCPATEHFYINLFPKPSAIANLMPRVDDEVPQDGYYEQYLGRLLQSGGIDGATMKQIDNWIRDDLNQQIKAAFAVLGDRAHFVDTYAATAAYDRKNGIAAQQVLVKNGATEVLIDNLPLEILPIIGGRRDGGLFGLDNLHPTIVGYSLIAQAVCDMIAATEGLPRPVIDQQACYDADSLLHNLPPAIVLTDFVLGFIGPFVGGGSSGTGS